MSDVAHLEMKLHALNDKIGRVKHDVAKLQDRFDRIDVEKLRQALKTIEESETNE